MISDGWDNPNNRERIMILSEDSKQVLIVVLGIVISIGILFLGLWSFRKEGNKHKEKLYTLGYSKTFIYKGDNNYSDATWIKGDGTPIIIYTKKTMEKKIN